MSNKIESAKAYSIHRKLIELKHTVESSGLLMGKLLYEIQENELYSRLGYETFEEYLADPELSFKRATAYSLKKTYKQWCLDFGYPIEELASVGFERLLEAGKVATVETKEEWLGKAQSLSRSDLLLEVGEKRGNEGKSDFVPMPRLKRCDVNGCKKWKVIDEDLICHEH